MDKEKNQPDNRFKKISSLKTQSPNSALEQASLTCPNCGCPLESRKCKLLCPRPGCGYMVTCSEW